MSKPLSDRWVDGYADALTEFPQTASRDIAIKALRELQRARAAIREHKQAVISGEIENDPEKSDTALWRATLPEGEK